VVLALFVTAAGIERRVAPFRKADAAVAVRVAVAVSVALAPAARTIWSCLRLVRQPETGQRHSRETDTEFLQRSPARDRLGQALREFIELVVHFDVVCLWVCPNKFVGVKRTRSFVDPAKENAGDVVLIHQCER